MLEIILIAACTNARVIGLGNQIPWHYSDDLRHFKQTTLGHPIVMGHTTFKSLNCKPLKNRTNIILSKQSINYPDCLVFNNIEDLLNYAKSQNWEKMFIIGGAQIYKIFMPIANSIILTLVKKEYNGDTFFPEFDLKKWHLEYTNSDYPDFDILYFNKK